MRDFKGESKAAPPLKKQDSFTSFYEKPLRPETYSYKMKILNEEIKKQSYARKNPELAKRKKLFFNSK